VDNDDLLPLDIIIGCSVGGFVALMLMVALIACCFARRRRAQDNGAHTMALPASATPTAMSVAGANSQRDMYSTRFDDTAPAHDGIYASVSGGATDEAAYGIGRIESMYNYNVIPSSSSAHTPYVAPTGVISMFQ
jgi:hypothetical protein